MGTETMRWLIAKFTTRNVLVYDSQAKLGHPTRRLFNLMVEVAEENGYVDKGQLTHFYIPSEIFSNLDPFLREWPPNGQKFIPYEGSDYLDFFKSMGATLAHCYYEHGHKDEYLIIGTDEKHERGIIGSC